MIASTLMFVIVGIFCLTTTGTAKPSRACYKAYHGCEFRFEGSTSIQYYSIDGKPDMSFTPRIIAKDGSILTGIFNTNGREPEFINRDGSVVPISKAKAATQRLSKSHFKPLTIRGKHGSGIARQTFVANQKAVATNRCVRVYFSQYQILQSRKPFIGKRNVTTNKRSKCVVFMTRR